MIINWNEYQKNVLAGITQVARLSPDLLRGYRTLTDADAKNNVLDAKTRELISLAVAVTRQCDGCIIIHTDAAIKQGATREEVAAAVGVAIAINAGAALVHAAKVIDAYDTKTSEK